MVLEAKYQVKKLNDSEVLKPDEYFVIRKQDILSVPAIWSYVNTLRTAAETLNLVGGIESEDEAKRLEELADKVSDLASLWADRDNQFRVLNKKLPD